MNPAVLPPYIESDSRTGFASIGKMAPILPSKAVYREVKLTGAQQIGFAVSEVALRVLSTLAVCAALYAFLPIGLSAYIIPCAAIGLTFCFTQMPELFLRPRYEQIPPSLTLKPPSAEDERFNTNLLDAISLSIHQFVCKIFDLHFAFTRMVCR